MIKLFCDRCEQPGNLTSRLFEITPVLNLEVILRNREGDQPHFCEDCLVDMLWDSLRSFPRSAIMVEYARAVANSTELEVKHKMADKLAEEKSNLLRQVQTSEESTKEMERRLTAANDQISGLVNQLRSVKSEMEGRAQRAIAEIRQKIEDERTDTDYSHAVARRERIRSGQR